MSVEWKARSKAPDAKATGIAKAPVPQRQNRRPDRYGKGVAFVAALPSGAALTPPRVEAGAISGGR